LDGAWWILALDSVLLAAAVLVLRRTVHTDHPHP